MKEISKSTKTESEQKQRKRLSMESRRSRNGVRIVDPNTGLCLQVLVCFAEPFLIRYSLIWPCIVSCSFGAHLTSGCIYALDFLHTSLVWGLGPEAPKLGK